jgi:hypothetical protein
LKSRQYRGRSLSPDVNANIRVQQETRIHLKIFSLLRWGVAPAARQKIPWQIGQKFERPRQSFPFLAQYDFVASAENLDLFALQPELLRQSDGLAIARPKNPRSRHWVGLRQMDIH